MSLLVFVSITEQSCLSTLHSCYIHATFEVVLIATGLSVNTGRKMSMNGDPQGTIKTCSLLVKGMTCYACVNQIEKALSKRNGKVLIEV